MTAIPKSAGPDTPYGRQWVYTLAAVCVLAAGLRAFGLGYGLPGVYNPDETPILNRGLAIAQELKPQNFVYPSLYFYLLFAWEGLFFVVGRLVGHFSSAAAFQQAFFIDPSQHFLAGRAFSVLCGTLTVVAVFLLGRRLYDRATGLAAAAALAVSPIAVRDAHYVKLDVPTTMFVAIAHVAFAWIVVNPAAARHKRSWIIAGFLSGLAVSAQYYAVFIAFTMCAVALADLPRSGSRQATLRLFIWCAAAAAVGFFVGSPFLPFNLQQAIADVAHVREVDVDRAMVGGRFSAVLPYLRIMLWDAMGWPVAIAGAVGLVWAVVSDWRRGLLLVAFFVPFFVFIANTVPMSRYLNVVLPLIALGAGFALVRFGQGMPSRARWATPVLVILALLPGLFASLEWDLFLRKADTRALAGEFITSHIPSGSSFLIQPYGPPLRQSREGLVEGLRAHLGDEKNASPKFQHMLALDPYPRPAYRLIYLGDTGLDKDKIYVQPAEFSSGAGLEPLRRRGISYVIIKKSNEANPEIGELEAALGREGRRLAEFTPYRPGTTVEERARVPPFLHNTAAVIHNELERPGPIIEVWALQ
jgi:hypothetical protein